MTSSCRQTKRRLFLNQGLLALVGTAMTNSALSAMLQEKPVLRLGLITDLHHADKASAGSRHYRDTLGKLTKAAETFEGKTLDGLVLLGDVIDAADSVDLELSYLDAVVLLLNQISSDRHYVLGNHCVDMLTKDEFLEGVGQELSYYSFDRAGYHFIILDACFRPDEKPYGRKNSKWNEAYIPREQLTWLAQDLKKSDLPTVVFAHQRLDLDNDYAPKNAAEVRQIFEASRRVLAVFQGHSHKFEAHEVGSVPYITLAAMIEGAGLENNAFSLLELRADRTISLTGFGKQKDWTKPS